MTGWEKGDQFFLGQTQGVSWDERGIESNLLWLQKMAMGCLNMRDGLPAKPGVFHFSSPPYQQETIESAFVLTICPEISDPQAKDLWLSLVLPRIGELANAEN